MQDAEGAGAVGGQDSFAELVAAVRQSLMATATPTQPAVPAEVVQAVHYALTNPTLTGTPSTSGIKPATFSRKVEDCNGFILQCSLYLEALSHLFHPLVIFIRLSSPRGKLTPFPLDLRLLKAGSIHFCPNPWSGWPLDCLPIGPGTVLSSSQRKGISAVHPRAEGHG